MTTELAFLEDICDNPDDDVPRLVFADWLEENGEEGRAQFIRLQCEQAKVPVYERRWLELSLQARPLEKFARKAQSRRRFKWVSVGAYERGFASVVTPARLRQLDQHAERFFATTPAQCLFARLATADVPMLAAAPWLARLSELRIGHSRGLNARAIEQLVQSPYATRWRGLESDEFFAVGAAGVRALIGSPRFEQFIKLSFTFQKIGGTVIEALARVERTRLETLRLFGTAVTNAHLRLLAAAPVLRTLTILDLDCNEDIGPVGLAALANSTHARSLRQLHLALTNTSDKGMRVLTNSPHLAGLCLLDLDCASISEKGVVELALSPYLKELRSLNLSSNKLRFAGELAFSPGMKHLVKLELGHNELLDDTALAIAESPYLTNLDILDLCQNKIGNAGGLALARSPNLENLRELWLTGNPIRGLARQELKKRFGNRLH
jgi:uncharacterized protein (TIGR02996 family)